MSDNKRPHETVKDTDKPDSKLEQQELPVAQPEVDEEANSSSESSTNAKKPRLNDDWDKVVMMDNGDVILLDDNFATPSFLKNDSTSSIPQQQDANGNQLVPINDLGCDTPPDSRIRSEMIDRFNKMSQSETLRAIWSGVFPMKWKESKFGSELVEHGILNRNSKCYLISVIQLLSHVPPFAIIMGIHDTAKQCDPENCLACEWKQLQFQNNTEVGTLDRFIDVLKSTWPDVASSTSEDAEECIYKVFQHFCSPLYDSLGLSSLIDNFEAIFGIEDECTACETVTKRPNERDYILKLMSSKNYDHLQTAIDEFFEPSVDDKIACPTCGISYLLRKRHIKATPNILLISDSKKALCENGVLTHICKKINLGKHAAMPDIHFGMYELCGIVNHVWLAPGEGHYFAWTKKYGRTKEWVAMNDTEIVEHLPEAYGSPYLLMYRRVVHCENDDSAAQNAPETSDAPV